MSYLLSFIKIIQSNQNIIQMCPHFAKLQFLISQTIKIQKGTHIYLLRHGQSLGNHAGSIIGWTDSKLSMKGRQQSNKLYRGLHKNINKFTQFHSSDLSRCRDTMDICLGFSSQKINYSEMLRELNFGDQEGVHYDSLPEEQKKIISSLDYKPPNGETWPQARKRSIQYFSTLKEGHHLILTHGGLMCALGYHLGIKKVLPNCSFMSAEFCHQRKDLKDINFVWEFPNQ